MFTIQHFKQSTCTLILLQVKCFATSLMRIFQTKWFVTSLILILQTKCFGICLIWMNTSTKVIWCVCLIWILLNSVAIIFWYEYVNQSNFSGVNILNKVYLYRIFIRYECFICLWYEWFQPSASFLPDMKSSNKLPWCLPDMNTSLQNVLLFLWYEYFEQSALIFSWYVYFDQSALIFPYYEYFKQSTVTLIFA